MLASDSDALHGNGGTRQDAEQERAERGGGARESADAQRPGCFEQGADRAQGTGGEEKGGSGGPVGGLLIVEDLWQGAQLSGGVRGFDDSVDEADEGGVDGHGSDGAGRAAPQLDEWFTPSLKVSVACCGIRTCWRLLAGSLLAGSLLAGSLLAGSLLAGSLLAGSLLAASLLAASLLAASLLAASLLSTSSSHTRLLGCMRTVCILLRVTQSHSIFNSNKQYILLRADARAREAEGSVVRHRGGGGGDDEFNAVGFTDPRLHPHHGNLERINLDVYSSNCKSRQDPA